MRRPLAFRASLLAAVAFVPATSLLAQPPRPEPVALTRAATARDAPTVPAASAGDGPWSRQKSMRTGIAIGGTIGIIAGGAIAASMSDCGEDDDAGIAGIACVFLVPFEVLAGGLIGGLVGGGAGGLIGVAVCERHDGGCVDEPPRAPRPGRGPRPLPYPTPRGR